MLPGRSGAAVCRTIHRQRMDVPVIVLTGYPSVAEMSLESGGAGVVACVQKRSIPMCSPPRSIHALHGVAV